MLLHTPRTFVLLQMDSMETLSSGETALRTCLSKLETGAFLRSFHLLNCSLSLQACHSLQAQP